MPAAPASPSITASKPARMRFSASGFALAAVAAKNLTGANVQVTVMPGGSATMTPAINAPTGEGFQGEATICRFFARQRPDLGLYGNGSVEQSCDVDGLLDLVSAWELSGSDASALAKYIDQRLTYRTFLVGDELTIADLVAWSFFSRNSGKAGSLPHFSRWMKFIGMQPCASEATKEFREATKTAASKADAKKQDSGRYDGVVDESMRGKVVTRFPPEPSGYLHIGHAKAALLNHFYAREFDGKLIIRFDDTNPAKEKDEFVENILKDLATLGIKSDVPITYTSDYFDLILELGEKMIREGKAYVDDTPVEQMREMRDAGTPCARRELPADDHLNLWKEMIKGSPEGKKCCVRAKIDIEHKNKAMRDPTIFRVVLSPAHHRTGTKYKCYPLYDFACPIVDSLEGVTTAMRTNEYRDRNVQYWWMQEALGMRKVDIQDYSRLNFIHTVLSKRKLTWFVQEGLVDGWNDPRFPTVQGIIRRGLTVESLRDFISKQGFSRSTNMMEWDKIWALNKQKIDPVAHRHWAISNDRTPVPVTLTDGPKDCQNKFVALHKKNPDAGVRIQAFHNQILMESRDFDVISVGEEITLMNIGNVIVDSIEKNAEGAVTGAKAHLNLSGDFKKTKTKVHYLCPCKQNEFVQLELVDFGHLITKRKIEEEDNFEDYVNRDSKKSTFAMGDGALRTVKQGEIIQLERKGFYRVDKAYVRAETPMVLFSIPTGKKE